MRLALFVLFNGIFGLGQLAANEPSSVRGLPLYFWDATPSLGFSNFGDALSEALINRILDRDVEVVENPFNGRQKLLAVGSILSYARQGDVIWGTGLNGKTALSAYNFTDLDVRAVRGPLTRQFLLERGVSCPEVYGDPTLLLPFCFPEIQKPEHPSREYSIVPHFSDERLFMGHPNLVSVKADWRSVVDEILDSKFIVASALSGVIVAESFGIPARLLILDNASNTENLLKYADYYQGTGRPNFQYATTLEEALEMGGESLPVCDLEKLYQAFPFEMFQ